MILQKKEIYYSGEKTTKVLKTFVVMLFLLFNLQQLSCGKGNPQIKNDKFKLGNENLLENISSIKDKRIAVLTNQTGILPDGTHIIDALVKKGVNIVKIFSPEHGIRGDENYSETDEKTGIKIISLYGGKSSPSADDLRDVDIVIYDIQDVGARFYTYTSTLYYLIQAAGGNGKKVIVCDRPMILNPSYVAGFMLDDAFSSFVGSIPAPICYGMTCGELANYLSASLSLPAEMTEVSKMSNYSRNTDYNALNLLWVKPSPSMFFPSTAICYPATCLLEGTNVSEGRGTSNPFEYFGAPWVNSESLANELNSYGLGGVTFDAVTFTPTEKISAYPPKFFNKECNGIFISVKDKNKFEPVKAGIAILAAMYKLCPEFKINKDNFIDKLAGTDRLRKMVLSENTLQEIVAAMNESLNSFNESRMKYLLYK
ncbi:MAG: DUF1343 domain-containing protein [Ignavibacteria bacterium]|nr:DUF1343 domain-containing protein [Ignavibacteria bacterium]